MRLSKSKKTSGIFYFNEAKYNRAKSEMQSYCNFGNKILAILKENELEINPTVAERARFASLDELQGIIMNEQRRRLKDIPDSAREQLIIKPNLNAIQHIRNSMAQMAAYNAGMISADYLQFVEDKFVVDETSLKEFFTIYRNETLTEIEGLANEFIEAWEKLKNNSEVQTFDNIINVYGIINMDLYSQSFIFNIKSPDLTTF